MTRLTLVLASGAFAVAGLTAAPADAACVGEDSLAYVCVTLPDVTVGEEPYCFYAGGDDCLTVYLPSPEVTGTVGTYCGGSLVPSMTWAQNCRVIEERR